MNTEILEQMIANLELVRQRVPLVHNITNYVTVNDVANAELAIGGSALMADDINEIEDMVALASCTNINMGTLNERTIESMIAAGKAATKTDTPMVFDPVGAGASKLRNQTSQNILSQTSPTVIRGNLSEISFVAGLSASTKGVDSSQADECNDPVQVAKGVAASHNCVVAITGAVDVVTDGDTVIKISNGSAQMSKITGTGCMCDGLIGCFVGALDDHSNKRDVAIATAAAIMSMGISGEIAALKLEPCDGLLPTGSLHVGIIDGLAMMNSKCMQAHAKIEVL